MQRALLNTLQNEQGIHYYTLHPLSAFPLESYIKYEDSFNLLSFP